MKREPKHLIFTADMQENARNFMPCAECGAPVGEPCVATTDGRRVHASRQENYASWLKAYYHNYRKYPCAA